MPNNKPLVAALSGVNWIGHAVLRQLAGSGLDVTVISSDSDDSALMQSWRGRELAIVVDPIRTGPGHPARVHRFVLPRPGGRLVVFTVEAGDGPAVAAVAREVAAAVVAEVVTPVAAVGSIRADARSTPTSVGKATVRRTRWDLRPVRG